MVKINCYENPKLNTSLVMNNSETVKDIVKVIALK